MKFWHPDKGKAKELLKPVFGLQCFKKQVVIYPHVCRGQGYMAALPHLAIIDLHKNNISVMCLSLVVKATTQNGI